MKTISWNDGLCHGGRQPRLYFLKNEKFYRFSGSPIDGICSCVEGRHTKNGKWSNSTYEITVSDSVGILDLCPPIHNRMWQEFGTFEEVQAEIVRITGQLVSVPVVEKFLEESYHEAFERLKKNEAAMKEVEMADEEPIQITFGRPTNAQRSAGFWSEPKKTPYGEVSLKETEEWRGACPDDVICPDGFVCVNVTRQPGMHGGYVTLHLRRVQKKEKD